MYINISVSYSVPSRPGFSEHQVTGDIQVSLEVCEGKLRFTVLRARHLKHKCPDKPIGTLLDTSLLSVLLLTRMISTRLVNYNQLQIPT